MITVFHLRDSPFVGGPEKQILGQCARLDRSRFEPVIVSFAGTGSNAFMRAAADLGIRAASVYDGKLAFPAAVRQLRALTGRAGECVIISSGFKADLTACLLRVPWIAWFHGHTACSPRVRFYEALDLLALRRADTTITVCESAARQLREIGLRRITVVPNAVDVDLIASHGTRHTARSELGIGDENDPSRYPTWRGPVVGTAARMSVEKGLGCFIDAAKTILASHPDTRFLLIGDGPLRAGLERRAERLGIASRFVFAGFRADAATLIKAMDVFVLPSLRENLPVALLEAMACGVSVAATDVGGVGEVLDGTGVAPIAPGSTRALAQAVIDLLDDPALRARNASALAIRAREFSFDRQVRLMEAAILAQTRFSGLSPCR